MCGLCALTLLAVCSLCYAENTVHSALGGRMGARLSPLHQRTAQPACLPADSPARLPAVSTALQVDKALVNVGAMFLETVKGRVSTEVDPRIAFDTGQCQC
jgi:transaldolase